MTTPRTILTLVNQAQKELGLTASSSIFSSGADNIGIQMGALSNRVLDELRRVHPWSAMQFEFDLVVQVPLTTTGDMAAQSAVINNIPDTSTLTASFFAVSGTGIPQASRILSVDSATQITMTMENTNTTTLTTQAIVFSKDTYALPSDMDFYSEQTMWDRTNFWKLLGPDSPQRDQYLRSGITPSTPRRHWRQLGPLMNQFRLWPPPTEIVSPVQLVFEYLSCNAVAVLGSSSAFAKYFVNDTDTCLLDEDALIQGIKWMFWEIKGMGSYVTFQNRWVDYVDRLRARDGGSPILNMGQREESLLISPANVPDGSWPSTP